MKRFLSTLVQFGSDISADTGERVRALVFSLVVSSRRMGSIFSRQSRAKRVLSHTHTCACTLTHTRRRPHRTNQQKRSV